ncbi:hypothetical protein Dimus_037573, partial [Dionaea muscipula]
PSNSRRPPCSTASRAAASSQPDVATRCAAHDLAQRRRAVAQMPRLRQTVRPPDARRAQANCRAAIWIEAASTLPDDAPRLRSRSITTTSTAGLRRAKSLPIPSADVLSAPLDRRPRSRLCAAARTTTVIAALALRVRPRAAPIRPAERAADSRLADVPFCCSLPDAKRARRSDARHRAVYTAPVSASAYRIGANISSITGVSRRHLDEREDGPHRRRSRALATPRMRACPSETALGGLPIGVHCSALYTTCSRISYASKRHGVVALAGRHHEHDARARRERRSHDALSPGSREGKRFATSTPTPRSMLRASAGAPPESARSARRRRRARPEAGGGGAFSIAALQIIRRPGAHAEITRAADHQLAIRWPELRRGNADTARDRIRSPALHRPSDLA